MQEGAPRCVCMLRKVLFLLEILLCSEKARVPLLQKCWLVPFRLKFPSLEMALFQRNCLFDWLSVPRVCVMARRGWCSIYIPDGELCSVSSAQGSKCRDAQRHLCATTTCRTWTSIDCLVFFTFVPLCSFFFGPPLGLSRPLLRFERANFRC